VARTRADGALSAFLAAPAVAVISIGETGLGKTALLCRWTEMLSRAGHVVFYYDCGANVKLEIERDIARDLGFKDVDALAEAFPWRSPNAQPRRTASSFSSSTRSINSRAKARAHRRTC
jgi:hypothetical protein